MTKKQKRKGKAALAAKMISANEKPVRFYMVPEDLRWSETLGIFFNGLFDGRLTWVTRKPVFTSVQFGEAGYDDAPYEQQYMFHRDAMKLREALSAAP